MKLKHLLRALNALSKEQLEQPAQIYLTSIAALANLDAVDVATDENPAVEEGTVLLLVHDVNTAGAH